MLYTNILFSYFNLCFSHIPNSFNFDANIYMLGFHYIVLIFILIVYIICFSFFVNPPALAQPVSLPSLPHHFSFPPTLAESIIQSSFPSFLPHLDEVGARVWSRVCNCSSPAQSWSKGLKPIDHLSSYRPQNRWWRQRIWGKFDS